MYLIINVNMGNTNIKSKISKGNVRAHQLSNSNNDLIIVTSSFHCQPATVQTPLRVS